MLIYLILKAINSQDVRASIDRTIIGDLKDLDRRLFEDETYYEILEILYSKKFRKYWINGILIA
jgi:hypothetical protein